MGIKEFRATGGNAALLKDYHRKSDSLAQWQINFLPYSEQTYAFDYQMKKTFVSDYMPRGYNCGFIYDGGSPHTIAHELGHGIAGLEHVFENSNNSGKTQNLMDYSDGEEFYINGKKTKMNLFIEQLKDYIPRISQYEWSCGINLNHINEAIKHHNNEYKDLKSKPNYRAANEANKLKVNGEIHK